MDSEIQKASGWPGAIQTPQNLRTQNLSTSELRRLDSIQDSGLRTQDSGLRTQDSGLRTQDSGLRTQDSGLRTQDSGLRTQDSGRW
eukprot:CAMPEP_0113913372 /NCGR_PEP_ID=MMETSP0780_2-20120614/29524_1 /TAXON_ID=652834 /ORGANISM="Palpitomonas bilix" /LENGTH=85 /DNA_ID=CAMNT_0000910591 /DNA_START=284 /DNA_END=538 /DNA_ORIENTATION=+ /assembly_acc=CAM_ASM_000599